MITAILDRFILCASGPNCSASDGDSFIGDSGAPNCFTMRAMIVGQILLSEASEYERKCQRIDHAILSEISAVHFLPEASIAGSSLAARLKEASIALVHAYGDVSKDPAFVRTLEIPWVASSSPRPRRFRISRSNPPALVAGPLTDPALPEAVEPQYFSAGLSRAPRGARSRYTIGCYGPLRPGVTSLAQRTTARLDRFRDDLDWRFLEEPPTPEDFSSLDLWVDPAIHPEDYDGFTAEAMVAGLPVVACRTPVNRERLQAGSGFAVPVDDPNELAHAIVTALFKDEIAAQRLNAAAAHAQRFRSSTRAAVLLELYNRILNG